MNMTEMQPIVYRGVACYSFKQLDQAAGAAKGTTFRTFKQMAGAMVEEVDYFYLDAERERQTIEALRAAGSIYRSSHHLVLLTDSGRQKLRYR
jgi:hypothetical protein